MLTIEQMRERKQELGYSCQKISELSGVPLGTVQKVFSGLTKTPRHETLLALNKVFGGYDVPDGSADSAGLFGKKQGEYTLEDYLALPKERRVELIDGVIYDMGSPTGYHQLIAGQLYSILLSWIQGGKGDCMPFISPMDVQLDYDNKTIVQPDVLILCDKSKYTPARIVGAPDYVAEILSKSTRRKDIFIKLSKYKNAGVREYWMIDPDRKTVMVWNFEKDDEVQMYGFRDRIPVGIYNGECVIDFAEIDDLVTPWM